MKKGPLLSICMPTYNRISHLKRQISYFQKELETINSEDIEIIISDNASEDGTYDFLKSIANDKIMINHNTENIGPMNNMNLLLGMAKGQYFWLLGDDDYLKEGLINRILFILKKEELSYLYLSRRVYNEQKKSVGEEGKKHCVDYNKAIQVSKRQLVELLVENFSDLKFQTSGIFKREEALKCEEEYHSLPELVRACDLTTFRAIRGMQRGKSYFVSQIEVLSGNEITWSDLYVDYTFVCDSKFIDFLTYFGFSDKECRKIKKRQMAANYSGALLNRNVMGMLKKRNYPEWSVSLIPVILYLGFRKIIRRFGLSSQYEIVHVDTKYFGIV